MKKKECGYELNVDYLAERTGARRVESSPTGYSFTCSALADLYPKLGLEVELLRNGGIKSSTCKICGKRDKSTNPSGSRAIHCDPELHNAYYRAVEGHQKEIDACEDDEADVRRSTLH